MKYWKLLLAGYIIGAWISAGFVIAEYNACVVAHPGDTFSWDRRDHCGADFGAYIASSAMWPGYWFYRSAVAVWS